MATMFPARFDDSTVSAAERRVFAALAGDPATADWTALHSLGLAARGTGKPYGEIDFVVLIPGGGILCLEVKGGRVRCQEGVWTTLDGAGRTGTMRRSPFLQAREGMFALREAVIQKFGAGHPAAIGPFGCAVLLPDVAAPPRTPEFEPWECVDQDGCASPATLSERLRRLARGTRTRLGWSDDARPAAAALREVRQFLRPDFERVVLRSTELRHSEERLVRLTSEQFDQLDLATDNPRCMFEGAAGTGKTSLARELARRRAEAGSRTLLVCYNKLLGDELGKDEHATGVNGWLRAGRFYQVLRGVILRSPSHRPEFEAAERQAGENGNFAPLFDEIYPRLGRAALLIRPEECVQTIVVDEAQDLLREELLDVFDVWLEGGLAEGNWTFFGDFEGQAIYGRRRTVAELRELMHLAAPHHVRGRLKVNCRNTRHIGEETSLLAGYESPLYRTGQVDGAAVDYHFYKEAEGQRESLVAIVRRLLSDGVPATDLVVLSRFSLERSAFAKLATGGAFTLTPPGSFAPVGRATPAVAFTTVHAFKGMESAVVILGDVEEINTPDARALLYIGMSRARALLVVLLHEETRPDIRTLVGRRLTASLGKNTNP